MWIELASYLAALLFALNLMVLIRNPAVRGVGGIVAGVLGLGGLLLVTPIIVWLVPGLVVAFAVHRLSGRRRWAFPAASVLAAVFALVWVHWQAQGMFARVNDRLRAEYPLESLAERVPAPRTSNPPVNLKEAVAARLDVLESSVAADSRRSDRLRKLHEETNRLFETTAGFGYARMLHGSALDQWPVEPKRQPGERDSSTELETAIEPARPMLEASPFHGLHSASVVDFVNPTGFGYVKSRQQVAGFQPHRFSEIPKSPDRWKLQTLDLVGLVMHDQPVAYVSEHLPRMDELQEAPTRELDAFESAGLATLRQGEDLYSRENGDTLRLFGAIRAAKLCTVCHGCERGEMLGAFSYVLKKGE